MLPPITSGDVDWSSADIAVRVVTQTPEYVELIVGSALPMEPRVSLELEHSYGDPVFSHHGHTKELSRVGPGCGTKTYTLEFKSRDALVTAVATSSGFDQPTLVFSVNGAKLGNPISIGASQTGAQNINIVASVPITDTFSVTNPTTMNVSFQQVGNTLLLTVPPGRGAFELEVRVDVAEAASGSPASANASKSVSLITLSLDLPEQAIIDLTACVASIVAESRTLPPLQIPDDHPDWLRRMEAWRPGQLASLGREIEALVAWETRTRISRQSLIAAAARALQISAPEVLAIARSVSKERWDR